jgi:hypothetical protein
MEKHIADTAKMEANKAKRDMAKQEREEEREQAQAERKVQADAVKKVVAAEKIEERARAEMTRREEGRVRHDRLELNMQKKHAGS